MINRALKTKLLEELKIKPPRLSQKIGRLKRLVPMETEEAAYVIAFLETGIDLTKYLDGSTVDKVRSLVEKVRNLQSGKIVAPIQKGVPASKKVPKTIVVSIGRFKLKDPILPESMLREAKQMAEEVYPRMYVFENSVRELIMRVLTSFYGSNWWNLSVPEPVKKVVKNRLDEEDKNPWHGKRGAHPIFYTDIGHLKQIVRANWKHFEQILGNQGWFEQRIEEINTSRRVVAHNNPLDKDDIKLLDVYFRAWEKLIQRKKSEIPMR